MEKLQFLDLSDLNPSEEEQLTNILYNEDYLEVVELPPEIPPPSWEQHPVPYQKLIKYKWKNFKDAYFQNKRIEVCKSEDAAKTCRKYVNEENPLNSTPSPQSSTDSSLVLGTDAAVNTDVKEDGDLHEQWTSVRVNKRSVKSVIDDKFVEYLDSQISKSKIAEHTKDDHEQFFYSLLPFVRRLEEDETLQFRAGVIQLVQQFKQKKIAHYDIPWKYPPPLNTSNSNPEYPGAFHNYNASNDSPILLQQYPRSTFPNPAPQGIINSASSQCSYTTAMVSPLLRNETSGSY